MTGDIMNNNSKIYLRFNSEKEVKDFFKRKKEN